MGLHHRPFLRGEPARLREDRARNPDLADVVEQRAELEPLERALAETRFLPHPQGEVGDPARVGRRVLVVRLERVRKRLDRRHEAPLEALVVRGVRDRKLGLVREATQ